MCRYVDVSTVDVTTSKLISEHIKASGASFLEVLFLFFFSVNTMETYWQRNEGIQMENQLLPPSPPPPKLDLHFSNALWSLGRNKINRNAFSCFCVLH